MPNINLQLEVQKCQKELAEATANADAARDNVWRLQGKIEAYQNLIAMIDAGKGNDEPIPEEPTPAIAENAIAEQSIPCDPMRTMSKTLLHEIDPPTGSPSIVPVNGGLVPVSVS